MLTNLINILLPPLCLNCGLPVGHIGTMCAKCWQDIDILEQPLCPILGAPLLSTSQMGLTLPAAFVGERHYDRVFSLYLYNGIIRQLIHALKFSDRIDLAIWLAQMLVNFASRSKNDILASDILVVPVPLHKSRLHRRFFNQSAELARNFAKLSGQNYDGCLLYRTRATTAQMGLARVERLKNLIGAFRVANNKKAKIRGKHILLIDDVFTTGSTLEACAKPLKKAGAGKITALTLARVL